MKILMTLKRKKQPFFVDTLCASVILICTSVLSLKDERVFFSPRLSEILPETYLLNLKSEKKDRYIRIQENLTLNLVFHEVDVWSWTNHLVSLGASFLIWNAGGWLVA